VTRNLFGGMMMLLLLGAAILLAGCAAGPSYEGFEARYYRPPGPGYYRGYEPEYSSPGEIPPYYYHDNPTYEHWFSAPYWTPDIGP
jgi:hypothetical protein